MHSCERKREREKGVCGRLSSASNLSAVISVRKRLGDPEGMRRRVRRRTITIIFAHVKILVFDLLLE